MKERGVVVASWYPGKKKLMVFDAVAGMGLVVPDKQYSVGAYIAYYRKEFGNSNSHSTSLSLLYGSELLKMPEELFKKDIWFVHHVFELCRHFIPLGAPIDSLFELIGALYDMPDALESSFNQKLFLYKLLFLLGVHPEDHTHTAAHMHYLAHASFAMLVNEPGRKLCDEDLLTGILRASIFMHPHARSFKTLSFLDRK